MTLRGYSSASHLQNRNDLLQAPHRKSNAVVTFGAIAAH